jgi:cob(I)alamin adenosyltransferase
MPGMNYSEEVFLLEKGLIQVYTGNGKGKSTAAFGLAIRAAGHGLKVVIIQFMKTGDYGENNSFKRLSPEITVKSFGRKGFIQRGGAAPEDYKLAAEALSFANEVLSLGQVDMLILDEVNNALNYQLIALDEIIALINNKPAGVELVLTGRNAPSELLEKADLITEMQGIKHHYQMGIGARKGIEY